MADPSSAQRSSRMVAARSPTRHSRGSKRFAGSPASSSSCRRRAEKHETDHRRQSLGRGRHRRRARRRRHDAARAPALLGTDRPASASTTASVGFLTPFPRKSWSPGVKRVFAGDYELVDLPTLEARAGEDRRDAGQRHRRHQLDARPDDRAPWTVGGEDLGTLRCDGLIVRDPVRLDRLQPLERWAGARLGPGRAGGHLCRTTFPPGSPARRSARKRCGRHEPDAGCAGVPRSSDGHAVLRGRARRSDDDPARAAANAARDAARGDVLLPLPAHIRRLIECKQVRAPTAAHREPRPHPRGGARLRARAERDHRRDRRRARRSSPRRSASCSARRATPPTSVRALRRPTSRPSSTCRTGCWTRTVSRRSRSCGRRTRTGWSLPGVSRPRGGPAPTRGDGRFRERSWRPSASG